MPSIPTITLSVSGYTVSTNAPYELVAKQGGAGETGLGLKLDSYEIDSYHYVQFNFTSLIAAGFSNPVLKVSSVQVGEGARFFVSSTAGQLGLQQGFLENTNKPKQNVFSISLNSTQYRALTPYFSVSAKSDDVLIGEGE